MRRYRGLFIALASIAGIGLSACGGNEPRPRTPSVEKFLTERTQLRKRVRCRAQFERCPGKPPAPAGGKTLDECIDEAEEMSETELRRLGYEPAYVRAVEAGTIDYAAKKAGECLTKMEDYVDEMSCVQAKRLEGVFLQGVLSRELVPACNRVFAPQATASQECEVDAECKEGLYCQPPQPGSEACGWCTEADGGARRRTRDFTFVRKGETCGGPNYDPICNPVEKLVCAPDTDVSGQYQCIRERSRSAGESCAFGACEKSLVCRHDAESGQKTCQPFEVVDEGEACADAETYCGDGLVCRVDDAGETRCAEFGGEGDSCRRDSVCAENLWCYAPNGRDGTCRAPPGEGEPCERGRCKSGYYCDYTGRSGGQPDWICRERAGEGEACSSGHCKEGLRCEYEPARGPICREIEGPSTTETSPSCRE